jgi:serine/threonine protein kinase
MAQDIALDQWMELDIEELDSSRLKLIATGHSHVYEYQDHFAVKIVSHERELEMMKKAGDCSITPRGRVLKRGRGQVGTIMDLGTPIDVTTLDLTARKNLMNTIIALVTALHEKGLLHGDIKLANILTAPDGSVRFCDFEGCQEEFCATAPEEQTLNWVSPIRLRNLDLPMRKADDLYALGLTIWEVFTGKVPFSGLAEDEVEAMLMVGNCIALSEIVEVEVREVIEKYLALGRNLA